MTDQTSPTAGQNTEPTSPLPTDPEHTAPQDTAPQNTAPLNSSPLHTAPAASEPASPAAEPLPRRRPLFATILWGALMLALAAFLAARELVPNGFDLVTWLLTAVVGIGLLLVAAGIAAASRRAG